MTVFTAFTDFQREVVNADPTQVALASGRRDAFRDAFGSESDVVEAFCSGSLRRRTQLRPIHDVDMIVVYRRDHWPDWGQPGQSAEAAIRHAQKRVIALLGATSGTHAQLVRTTRASRRGRSVKCFIDTTDTTAHDAFTVDVMPVLRNDDGTLLLPSQNDECWTTANPEYLIHEVADRHANWDKYRPTVRLLKLWARTQVPTTVKSLVIEVLALHHLPTDAENVPEALRRFFTAAAAAVGDGVDDPAGFCSAIQPDLDDVALRKQLESASDHAEQALTAAALNDQHTAVGHWRDILGPEFAPDHDEHAPPPAAATAAVTPRPVRDAPQG